MDFRHIANFLNSPDSVEDLSVSSPPPSDDDIIHIKTERPVCCGCRAVIQDRWMLHAGNQPYHLSCLRCCVCLFTLDKESSCFIRDGNVYCKYHYTREFGTKCAACGHSLEASDWVRYARDFVFHLNCFTCSICGVTLSTGEEFLMSGNRPFCRTHGFMEMHNGKENMDSASVSGDSDCSERPRKRARSNFTKEQLNILRSHFNVDPNPTSTEVDTLSELTGHSYKVIQIWFQNARARHRKTRTYKKKATTRGSNENMPVLSPWSSASDSQWSRDSDSPGSQLSLPE